MSITRGKQFSRISGAEEATPAQNNFKPQQKRNNSQDSNKMKIVSYHLLVMIMSQGWSVFSRPIPDAGHSGHQDSSSKKNDISNGHRVPAEEKLSYLGDYNLTSEFVHQSFEEIGQMAVGVTYGHLHFHINTTAVLATLWDQVRASRALMDFAQGTLGNMSVIEPIQERFLHWREMYMNRMTHLQKETGEIALMVEHPRRLYGKKRTTRQAGLGLAAVGVAGFGFALYEKSKLDNLEYTVDNNADALAREIRVTAYEFNQTVRAEIKLAEMVNETRFIEDEIEKEFTLNKFKTEMEHHYTMLRMRVERWREGVMSLSQGMPTADILPVHIIRNEMERLELLAKMRGLRMLHHNEMEYYRFETSTIRKPDGVRLFLHVPLSRAEVLKVYRHVPSPFYDAQEDVVYTVQPEEDVIAFNPVTGSSTTLKLAELNRCRRVNGLYYCEHQRILDRTTDGTCVGAMFSGYREEVKRICKFRVDKVRDVVVALSHEKFRIFTTKKDVRVYRDCEQDYVVVRSGQDIVLKPGCSARTASHWFTATEDLASEKDVVVSPILVNSSVLPMEWARGKVKGTLDEIRIDGNRVLVDLDDIYRQIKRTPKGKGPLILGVGASLLAVLLIVVAGLIMWWKVTSRQRRDQRAVEPRVTFSAINENETDKSDSDLVNDEAEGHSLERLQLHLKEDISNLEGTLV